MPALYVESGQDLIEGGRDAGEAAGSDCSANRCHTPADGFSDAWTLDGVIDDLQALYRVGPVLVDGAQWPDWCQGNALRATRENAREDDGG